MANHFSCQIPGMDTNDIFIKLGFCADYVRVTNWADGVELQWARHQGNDNCIARVAAGDRTVTSGSGIKLVKFGEMSPHSITSDPSEVEAGQWNDADGIQITSDAALLGNDQILLIEAWGMDWPMIRAVHDGGDTTHTYIQDSSIDFRDAGVSTGWIVYNQTNGNYSFAGEVQKPSGYTKYCRVTLVEADGTATAAADIDDDDVLFLYPKDCLGYPLSDLGAMT